MLQRFEDDLGAVFVVEPRGGDDGFEADAAVDVVRGTGQQRGGLGDLRRGEVKDVDGGRAGAVVLGSEELLDQAGVGFVLGPGGPKRFAEVVLVARVGLVELGGPGLDGGDDFAGRVAAEFTPSAVA